VAPGEREQPGGRLSRPQKLGQHREIEDKHLGIGDIGQKSLPPPAERGPAPLGPARPIRTASHRGYERLDTENGDVTDASPLDRLEDRLRVHDDGGQAAHRDCPLLGVGRAYPERREPPSATPASERVLGDDGEVTAGNQDEPCREEKERAVGRPVHSAQRKRRC
jgi:hypothetical protein